MSTDRCGLGDVLVAGALVGALVVTGTLAWGLRWLIETRRNR